MTRSFNQFIYHILTGKSTLDDDVDMECRALASHDRFARINFRSCDRPEVDLGDATIAAANTADEHFT